MGLNFIYLENIIHTNYRGHPSPLQSAMYSRDIDEVKRLINFKIVNYVSMYNTRIDWWYGTPLMIAIKNYNRIDKTDFKLKQDWIEIINLLIKKSSNVNEVGFMCYSPLHEAVKGKDQKVIDILIDNGAIIDRKNCHGSTPLHIAVELNNVNAITKMIDAGANPYLKNNKQESAIELAETQEIYKLLITNKK